MFLRNCWYIAAEAGEVSRQPLGRMLLGEPVVLYRKADGVAVALEDRCCHRRAPLHKGKVIGDTLQCGYHGFVFDEAGSCIKMPGHDRLPLKNVGVRAYPLCERHRFLWIWMGESEKADPALIPDFHTNDDPHWTATGMRLPVAANYLLLVENLIDLSHVAFVHPTTIGTDDTAATLEFDRGMDMVRVIRTAIDVDTPPHNRTQGLGPRSDQSKIITFLPPCHITIDITTTERAAEGVAPRSVHIFLINSITPETEGSSHYFWTSTRDFAVGDAATTEFMHRITLTAFNEDKDILEAQQRCIALDPEAPTINVHSDWGAVQAKRMMSQLIEAEADHATAAQ